MSCPGSMQIDVDPVHGAGALAIVDARREPDRAHFVDATLRALVIGEHAQRQNVRRIGAGHHVDIGDAAGGERLERSVRCLARGQALHADPVAGPDLALLHALPRLETGGAQRCLRLRRLRQIGKRPNARARQRVELRGLGRGAGADCAPSGSTAGGSTSRIGPTLRSSGFASIISRASTMRAGGSAGFAPLRSRLCRARRSSATT